MPTAIRPKPRGEFGNLKKYVSFLRKNTERSRIIRPGHFYSFVYDFDKTQPFKKVKFWDLMPLIFLYEVDPKIKGLFRGLNFHHMPLRSRQIWTARVKNIAENEFENDKRMIRLAKYRRLFVMFRRASKASARQYYLKNTRQLRRVPTDVLEEAMKYYSRTYFGASIGNIERNYLKIVP